MNYRPYPDVSRSLAQVQRGRVRPEHYVRQRPDGVIEESYVIPEAELAAFHEWWLSSPRSSGADANVTVFSTSNTSAGAGAESPRARAQATGFTGISAAGIAYAAEALRHFGESLAERPRGTGKAAIIEAIVDQAVKAGEHVHVAGHDGVRCAGGDDTCTLPRTMPRQCPGCGHAQHAPGVECETSVEHGPNRWHRCLCLATPGASRACPPQMDCQGGTLGFADIVHLREGRTLRGTDGETITPDVLAEPHPIVLARTVRTCTAVPSQWNAWTVDGQYLYLRYRSGIGTADAYADEHSENWTRIPDGAVARFDTGDRLDGEMTLIEFCQRAGLQLADDAEVIGE
ncbi:hypothetical protein [Streptomyces cylindrosporus]|uniref:Uncharacterized protein n=1 Tax=Streptomyces cylindrosporus TaxID=2927583 RepID=A0ABS9YJV4_9ACTN|nr:hypothetical protein [Streptomyces cylindrosporus]MCI3277503.1 hypothetical protein [Streptomyces cylindrosporus]